MHTDAERKYIVKAARVRYASSGEDHSHSFMENLDYKYQPEQNDNIVDGTPLGEPFMIKNKPVSFKVPTVAEVQVLGTRDGGGGITYGVYYELNQTTYFNGVNQGGSNLYTLIRE